MKFACQHTLSSPMLKSGDISVVAMNDYSIGDKVMLSICKRQAWGLWEAKMDTIVEHENFCVGLDFCEYSKHLVLE